MKTSIKYIITLLFVLLDIQSSASIITLYNSESDLITENTIPKRLYIDGGYIDINFNFNTTSYKYYIYDHPGSVRAVLNSSGTVIQSTDYSAYGVPSTRYQMNADNRFHLGLEWQPMKGLYGYYNNARFRDALLAGTFLQQDPLAEKYYPFSPYHYGAANPLRFIDIDGKEKKEFLGPTTYDNKIIKSYFNNFNDGEELYVFAHGLDDGTGIVINNGSENQVYKKNDTHLFKTFLQENYETFEDSQTIVLISCNTGKGSNSFAEILSTTIQDKNIIAPSGIVSINQRLESNMKGSKNPQWKTFKNGEVVERDDGKWLDNKSLKNDQSSNNFFKNLINRIINYFQ